jgi:succinyl-diaminopimelate desuccinylase
MGHSTAVQLASELVRLNTVNPGGGEAVAARLVADFLADCPVQTEFHELGPGRESLIVRYGERDTGKLPLCFSGHLDTVPLGTAKWARNPLSGEIADGRLWGRGSTDMKGGIAAMVVAFQRLCRSGVSCPVILALTASEETGCQGASAIAGKMGRVGGLIIAEPTHCSIATSHKGALWLRIRAVGKAAHGSKPELGDNAIDSVVQALAGTREIVRSAATHARLGPVTSNVGTIVGGTATNMVADSCEATVDIRLTPGLSATTVLRDIRARLRRGVSAEPDLALDAVDSATDDPWILSVIRDANRICGTPLAATSASFFTDASVLVPALGNPPVAIVGPGDPHLAHQVDESCSVEAIDRATDLYELIGRNWQDPPLEHLR